MVTFGGACAHGLRLGAVLLALVGSARADVGPGMATLSEAYMLDELFAIIAEEGRDNAATIHSEVLDHAAGDAWDRAVRRLYDPARLHTVFLGELTQELATQPQVIDAALAFADAPAGRQLIQLEIEVRAAMLDDDIDAAARDRLAMARDEDADTLGFVRERIAVHDLVEMNVSLGLNSALAYFTGFNDTAPGSMRLDAGRIMGDVWQQEPAIRAEVGEWLEAYFLLAYSPLSEDARAEAMVHFEASEGAAFNTAMFNAFDRVFAQVSAALGAEVGRVLAMRDI